MAGKRANRKQQEARRQAHLDRVAGGSAESTNDERRARRRDDAARAAAVGPSAARWLVPGLEDATRDVRAVDVVSELLALDPRTRLRGRGDEELRRLAGHVESLVTMGAAAPSGRPLLDVLVADAADRAALQPALDVDALLADAPVTDHGHDRTVRLAEAMLGRAAAHRDGQADLYQLVAPVGTSRHASADEIETLVRVATEGVALLPGPDPAVVTVSGGWVATSPLELFLTAARGLLEGGPADVGGPALYAWLDHARVHPDDPWWTSLSTILEVDAPALLQQAAARAGSDHPDVAGGVLTELIALRHPLL